MSTHLHRASGPGAGPALTPTLLLSASTGPAGTTTATNAAAFTPDVLAKLQELEEWPRPRTGWASATAPSG
ncbi:hypothetical protein [Streptomyces lincolnensis]|uniref:hypothetical protein n=1 Tax=Streptomyces lincolnensis TaxID=1915 RepID=UPI0037CF785F